MSVESLLLDFQVVGCTDDTVYIRDVATVATCVAEELMQDCLEQGCISSAYSYSSIYSGPKDSIFTIKHYFREGLITLTIEYFKINDDDALFPDYDAVERLQKLIKKNLDAEAGHSMPGIKRCLPKSPYLRSSDDRIMEYKWDKLLFSEQSPFQKVEIFQTTDFGAVLVLDDYVNLAESDIAYTHNLMCKGKMDYKDKTVLILGGGDGALLHELQQDTNPPKHVTMVDIDEAVIRGCREHMKSVCGTVLEKLETDKYHVIVDDAFKWIAKYKEEGKQFDVIFGDLTDIPVHEEGETWQFVKSILQQAFTLLPVGGRYLTHCNGKNASPALTIYENLLNSLGVPLEFTKTEAFIPSFQETWVFYQVTKKGTEVSSTNGDVKEAPEKEKKEEKGGEEKKDSAKSEKKKPATPDKKEEKKSAGAKGVKEGLGEKNEEKKAKKGK